ncbi:hypothetical protein IMAU80038_01674 [Lactiplantibacillus plantarum]|nr:hypothetical protein [Lactiplantibacillus plantarum]MCG0592233.1 hypothetical protein [Lactiplantibacillus plantarum]MCG0670886.1 hypothetical protein [Lactiplantibacillus plantarum]MCG0920112.1 hypothetical protein [Lactiplantibacillus plantarum]
MLLAGLLAAAGLAAVAGVVAGARVPAAQPVRIKHDQRTSKIVDNVATLIYDINKGYWKRNSSSLFV